VRTVKQADLQVVLETELENLADMLGAVVGQAVATLADLIILSQDYQVHDFIRIVLRELCENALLPLTFTLRCVLLLFVCSAAGQGRIDFIA
jgi:hypothetical protein